GVDFKAESGEKAITWDVDYIRPIASGDKFTVKWLGGLRAASYEESQEFFGAETSYGTDAYRQRKAFHSDAFGFRVGATAEFDFPKAFSMEASAAFSFMQAKTDGEAHLSDDTGAGPPAEIIKAHDNNINGEIRDYGIKGVWDAGPVDVYVGYSASEWSG